VGWRVTAATGVVVRGEHVVLRPYRAEELDLVEAALQAPEAREWLPLGAPPRHELRRRVDSGGEPSEGRIDLAIEAGGRLVGEIDARHPRWATPPGVWEIGISMFSAADRGRGYGREAVALLCDRLFEREGAHRVALSTDLDNAAMRAVAERCGFRMEGVLRSFMPHGDERRDYALYAITRDDWTELRSTGAAPRAARGPADRVND
jgi:RimJ/RimL family protein N-acetyltransferase